MTASALPPARMISATAAALRSGIDVDAAARRRPRRQRQRDRAADVGGRAGDERGLAGEQSNRRMGHGAAPLSNDGFARRYSTACAGP